MYRQKVERAIRINWSCILTGGVLALNVFALLLTSKVFPFLLLCLKFGFFFWFFLVGFHFLVLIFSFLVTGLEYEYIPVNLLKGEHFSPGDNSLLATSYFFLFFHSSFPILVFNLVLNVEFFLIHILLGRFLKAESSRICACAGRWGDCNFWLFCHFNGDSFSIFFASLLFMVLIDLLPF